METLKLKYPAIANYIGGQFIPFTGKALDVQSPISGEVISTVPLSGSNDLHLAVEKAKAAWPAWAAMPVKERVQVFYRYKTLMEKHLDELSRLVQEENGKTFEEAKAEVEKSIELTEFACSLPQLISGELLEVSRGVECRVDHKPLGIVASIAPFNFPHMVPHWTIPNAIALGNCMILKPSEQVPLSAVKIANMLKEAGLPDGVFNVVNGDREIVEAICDHPDITAVSFVGSTKIAKVVYRRATDNLKRCVALGGAKKSPDSIAGCASGYDGKQCYSFNVGLCRTTVHGCISDDGRGRS